MAQSVAILVDTCVWLDLAKDYRQRALLSVVEELVKTKQLILIVPRVVLAEFSRNKQRVTDESCRSVGDTIRRVKDMVDKLADGKDRSHTLRALEDVRQKIPQAGEHAIESIGRVEALLKGGSIIETSDAVKLRVADRALTGTAPFHRSKNCSNDAVLIEIYRDLLCEKATPGNRYAFVTHNTTDFSDPNGDKRLPHPHLAALFSKIRSKYSISLAATVKRIAPELVTKTMLDEEFDMETRRLSEIYEAVEELTEKIWYDRHQQWVLRVRQGKDKIAPDGEWKIGDPHSTTLSIWKGARRAARRVEKKYGETNLGPWTKFEWGMMNGKLSALRWVLGDEWDMLDT